MNLNSIQNQSIHQPFDQLSLPSLSEPQTIPNPVLEVEGEARQKENEGDFVRLANEIHNVFTNLNTTTVDQIVQLFKNIYQYENGPHEICLTPFLEQNLNKESLNISILSVLGNGLTKDELEFYSKISQQSELQKISSVSHSNFASHSASFSSAAAPESYASQPIYSATVNYNSLPLTTPPTSLTPPTSYSPSEMVDEQIENPSSNPLNLSAAAPAFSSEINQLAVSTLMELSRLPAKKKSKRNEREASEGAGGSESQQKIEIESDDKVKFDLPNKSGKRKIAILEKFVSNQETRESTNLELAKFNAEIDPFIILFTRKYPNKNEFRAAIGKVHRIYINERPSDSEESKKIKEKTIAKINNLFELLIDNGKHEKFKKYVSQYAGKEMFCALANYIAPILKPELQSILIDTLASTNLNFDSLRNLSRLFASLSNEGLFEDKLVSFFKNVYVNSTNKTYNRTTNILKKAAILFKETFEAKNEFKNELIKSSLLKLLNRELQLIIDVIPSLKLYLTEEELLKISKGLYLLNPNGGEGNS